VIQTDESAERPAVCHDRLRSTPISNQRSVRMSASRDLCQRAAIQKRRSRIGGFWVSSKFWRPEFPRTCPLISTLIYIAGRLYAGELDERFPRAFHGHSRKSRPLLFISTVIGSTTRLSVSASSVRTMRGYPIRWAAGYKSIVFFVGIQDSNGKCVVRSGLISWVVSSSCTTFDLRNDFGLFNFSRHCVHVASVFIPL